MRYIKPIFCNEVFLFYSTFMYMVIAVSVGYDDTKTWRDNRLNR